jgi:uncharacterized damage-inducible protein DinB
MTVIDDHGRPEPEPAVGEVETLLGFLDYQRATLEWKCRGVDAAGFRVTVGASKMTLAGLLKHMSYVEDHWFSKFLHANEPSPPWDTVDWKSSPDWEWDTAPSDGPEAVRGMWSAAVARSRELTTRALSTGSVDQLARRTWDNGEAPSLRWILVHMIEEYARHNGHADLIREVVDGETGE